MIKLKEVTKENMQTFITLRKKYYELEDEDKTKETDTENERDGKANFGMSDNTIHTTSSSVTSKAVTTQSIADSLIHTLSQAGFTIQRYDASTTDSIYLKLDYGVGNSIRISNHTGKKHLNYRYNVILDGTTEDIMSKYIRHYYRPDDINKMVKLIMSERHMKIQQYGRFRYNEFMKSNRENHDADKHGFWKTVRIIPAYSK